MTNGSDTVAIATPPVAGDVDRLAELRAKRKALEQAREARENERAATKAIVDEERAIADEEAIVNAEREHGEMNVKIRIARTPAGMVIVKRPNNLLFRKWADNGKNDSEDLEKLMRPCVIYPTVDVLDRWLSEQPAIAIDIANACTWLAGARARENAAK